MTVLQGVKVLDFTTLLPGPFATQTLADLGADILQIVSPTRHDLVRTLSPIDEEGMSAAGRQLHRSKEVLPLDLKEEGAKERIYELIEEYDIIFEQFRPGVMARLGLDYETLRKINPRIIYCSITGYGQTGPYRDRAGHDLNYLSLAGISNYSRREGERPSPLGVQLADLAGGSLYSLVGVLAALYKRTQTGEGDYVDISMTDASFSLNVLFGSGVLATGEDVGPESNLLNGGDFYDYYETSDGRYLSVGSLEPPFRKELCEIVGLEEWYERTFTEDESVLRAFKEALRERLKTRDFASWCAVFEKADCCVEPVLTLKEAMDHPQLRARDMIVDVPKEDGTVVQQIGQPIQFQNNPPTYRHVGRIIPKGETT